MNNHLRSVLKETTKLEVISTLGLRCYLLGGFRICRGEHVLTEEHIHLHKARDLLKLLALAPDHRLHREQLLEMLWPEQAPQAAAHNLSQTLYTIRPRLGELDPTARLEFEHECLVFRTEGGIFTDVGYFEQAARIALSQTCPINTQVAAYCQEAIATYTGDLLPEDGPSDLFYQRRDQLRALYIDLLLKLADYSLGVQEYLPAIDVLQKAIAADSANEDAHTRLMRAYALNGQRQAALRQYLVLEEALKRELEVEPAPESQQLKDDILSGSLAPSRLIQEWMVKPPHNLPALFSSFIGRDRETAQVRELVRTNRLVMLTGAGGVGKTRLGLKVAEGLLDEFLHGVYWVELASVSNPSLVAKAILDVFQISEQYYRSETERLVDFLKPRSLLLLLDNCEHLITCCGSLVDILLKACPHLHILATSRVRLNLDGEIAYRVPSLAVPDLTYLLSLPELAQYDAVCLFTERSSSYSHGFTLTKANASAVAHICQRLDGIPLALELAAARSRMMTAEQIVDQLKDVFRLLVSGTQTAMPHHRTLRASLEWSYDLLSSRECLLLQRLSVFSGGWELAAAEAVCAGEEIGKNEVMDLLSSLVDQSLVLVGTLSEGEARYHLLETVRQFAYERLVESAAETLLSQRHLAYFLKLAEQADLEIRGPRQLSWIKCLEKEHSNLTSTLERGLSSPTTVEWGVQLASALTWYWSMVGDFISQKYFLRKALSASADFGRTATKAKLLFQAGASDAWGWGVLEPDEAKACVEESLEIWRELEQDTLQEQAQCLLALGWIQKGDFSDARGFDALHESINIFHHKTGSTWWHAWALNTYVMMIWDTKDRSTIQEILLEEISLWRKTGDRWGLAMPIYDQGALALKYGDFHVAQQYLFQSLEIYQELGSKGMAYQVLRDLGHAARGQKKYAQAENYYQECIEYFQYNGFSLPLAKIYRCLGYVMLHKDDPDKAGEYLSQAMRQTQEADAKAEIILCIAGFACLKVSQGKWVAAACLFGAVLALIDANHIPLAQVDQNELDHFLSLCREKMEKDAFEQSWHTGSVMNIERAVAFAFESLN